uniref:Methyltransferase type 11 domain-containing protein n=1 Tax=Electrophorus electricus TaxID=8005 RepID=A0AAY5EP06_ELEEL
MFEAKEHTSAYWKYRISPSEELINNILTFFKINMQGCDLQFELGYGLGSGQGTIPLIPHFTQVVGTVITPAKLEAAVKQDTASNIYRLQCPAEELPFEDESVNLVTAMSEADGILKPGGCLAFLSYCMHMELIYYPNNIPGLYTTLWPYLHPYLSDGTFTLDEQVYNTLQYPVKE